MNKVIKYVTPFLLLLAIVFMINVHVAHADDDDKEIGRASCRERV